WLRMTRSQRWLFVLRIRRPPRATPFPYTTLFRSARKGELGHVGAAHDHRPRRAQPGDHGRVRRGRRRVLQRDRACGRHLPRHVRSEEHTSELQSRENLVCRLLLEKKKNEQQQRK